ncbi:MAG: alpha-amylase [Paludibacteraceae bacterium]|nr:alpha-amylase [Paludibacteraceae bacterium]
MINIYQLLPRLFCNANGKNIENGTIEENGCGKLNSMTAKVLNDIRKQGYTHIWTTGVIEHATKTDYTKHGIDKDHEGVVKGQAGSPYAIKDYYDIDPDLAENVEKRMEEFESLIERTHKASLALIIDFVPNHVARHYHSDAKPKRTTDLGAKDDTTKAFDAQNNFYYMPGERFTPQFDAKGYDEFPAKATGNDVFSAYPSVNDWYETVKLNYGVDYCGGRTQHFDPTPDTWKKMKDILMFWAKKGVDGFRCDMAEMVPVEFWHWAIAEVKKKYPSIIFIAEVYNPDQYRNYIHHGGFDYLYDKVGLYDTLRAATRQETSASSITGSWQAVDDIQSHMLNFLENHDEQRIASDFFAGDGRNAIAALIVSATLSSAPFMVYAGQEFGERGMDKEGFSGRDGRTTIFDYWKVDTLSRWHSKQLTEQESELQSIYRTVLNLRAKEPALMEGSKRYDLQWLNFDNPDYDDHRVYSYFRQSADGKETLLVAVNFGEQDADVSINISSHAMEYLILKEKTYKCKDLLSGKQWSQKLCADEKLALQIPAKSGVIVKMK